MREMLKRASVAKELGYPSYTIILRTLRPIAEIEAAIQLRERYMQPFHFPVLCGVETVMRKANTRADEACYLWRTEFRSRFVCLLETVAMTFRM